MFLIVPSAHRISVINLAYFPIFQDLIAEVRLENRYEKIRNSVYV